MNLFFRFSITLWSVMVVSALCVVPNTYAADTLVKQGNLVKFRTDSRVFVVLDTSGNLEWIKTEAEFNQRGFNFSRVITLPDGQFPLYHISESQIVPTGSEPHVATVSTPVSPNVTPMVIVKEGDRIFTDINGDIPWSAASITKLMTALVLNDMNLDWSVPITMTKEDELGGARLRMPVGTRYSRIDLLHASLMGSANNSTYALARTSGISIKQFVERMNAKARELGMNNSYFADPTGLNENNVSTAEDIALLIEAANNVQRIADIGKKTQHEMISIGSKPVSRMIGTTNALLRAGDPVSLGKTGYLVESRYNFTVLAKSPTGDARTVVVLNAPTQALAYSLAKKYVYQQYE